MRFTAVLLAALALTQPAAAATNLVVNGGFESFDQGGVGEFGTRYTDNVVTGWTTGGYNFVFDGSQPDSYVPGEYGGLRLWGPNNGSNNGLTNSPDGGNFVGLDSAFGQDSIRQTLSGLIPGRSYTVSFYWAAAQQYGFDGDTFDKLTVSLGNQSFSTDTVNVPNHGFEPWRQVSATFTAQTANDVLAFFASGGPPGVPPFALIDGVSVYADAVPAPAAISLLGLGLVGLAAARRRRG